MLFRSCAELIEKGFKLEKSILAENFWFCSFGITPKRLKNIDKTPTDASLRQFASIDI
jgi:hypothetical protein